MRTLSSNDNPGLDEVFINEADGKTYKAFDDTFSCNDCVFGPNIEGCATAPDCTNFIFVLKEDNNVA